MERQSPLVPAPFGVADSRVEEETGALALRRTREHGIEGGSVEVPASIGGHIDEIIVEECRTTPGRSRAIHFAVFLRLESVPHAEMRKERPDRGRQRLADTHCFVMRRLDHDHGKRRGMCSKRQGGRGATGSAADDGNVEGKRRHAGHAAPR